MNIGLRKPIRHSKALSNNLDKTTGNIFKLLNISHVSKSQKEFSA